MRSLVKILVIVVVVVGLLIWLAGRSGEQPQKLIEKPVSLDNSAG